MWEKSQLMQYAGAKVFAGIEKTFFQAYWDL
jgi:hypothetical protein